MGRTLVAGFGNLLRGDDGFGVEVIRRLYEAPARPDAVLLDVGTGGMLMAQELMSGYDRLVIVDAMDRAAPPGTVFLLRVDQVTPTEQVDAHLALPATALGVARALNVLPPEVYMVGCQPDRESIEDLTTDLSEAATQAVGKALQIIDSLLDNESVPGRYLAVPPNHATEVL